MLNPTIRIIILGNGFDLAHGLKTDYSSYVKHVIESRINGEDTFSQLLNFTDPPSSFQIFQETGFRGVQKTTSNLFLNILRKLGKINWCDIEQEYFENLNRAGAKPKEINDEFELIKNALEIYLRTEIEKANPIAAFKTIFESSESQIFVINFNYTNLYKFYFPEKLVCNLHGQIDDPINKIIFGYAAEDSQCDELLDKGNKEYLRNIKKFNYKLSHEYERLMEILNSNEWDGSVSIFGHSCGLSDRLIIKQIMGSEMVKHVRIIYHKGKEDYLEKIINISRICRGDAVFKKIVNFSKLTKMPQYDDESESIKS